MISNNFRKLILLISLIAVTTSMMSQKLITSIDSTSIFVGEEITYKLEVHSDTLAQIKFPESESFVPMEVLKTYDSDTIVSNEKYIVSKKYGLTNFDAASYILPKQKVVFGDTTLFSDSKKIEVKLVEVDTSKQGLYDIKPIFITKKEYDLFKYIPYLILLLIIVFLYVYRNKIFKGKKFQYEKSPYQKAKDEINLISKSGYTAAEGAKEYYSKLSFIIRNFLEIKVFDHSLESTTDELLYELKRIKSSGKLKLTSSTLNNLHQVLQTADLVKFAKYYPDEDIAKKDTEKVKITVDEINNILPEPTIEELKKDYEFHQKLLKQERSKRIKKAIIGFMGLLISTVLIASVLFGFTYVKDSILRNDNLILLETKNWVTTEYGAPGITVKTPEVLTRKLSDPNFKYLNSTNLSEFSFNNSDNLMQIYVSNTRFNDKIKPEDFQKYIDYTLDTIEAMGLSNIVVKYENFTTANEAEGIRVYGSADFIDSNSGKIISGKYSILGFFTENEFKQLIIIHEDDIYLNEITDNVISSVELIKKQQK